MFLPLFLTVECVRFYEMNLVENILCSLGYILIYMYICSKDLDCIKARVLVKLSVYDGWSCVRLEQC